MARFTPLLLLLMVLGLPGTVQALELGAGIRCEGRRLLVQSRKLSLPAARARIDTRISQTRARIRKLKQTTNAAALRAARAEVQNLQSARKQLRSCTSGKIEESVQLLRDYLTGQAGTYEGEYQDSTLTVSGPISLTLEVVGDRFSGTLAWGGVYQFLFGTSSVSFDRSIKGIPFPLRIEKTGTEIGDLVLVVVADGSITLDIMNVPVFLGGAASMFRLEGRFAGNQLAGSYVLRNESSLPALSGSFLMVR